MTKKEKTKKLKGEVKMIKKLTEKLKGEVKMIKKATWTTKLGEEIDLIFDEDGYFEDFSPEVPEEIRKDFEFFTFPRWEEFDIRWKEFDIKWEE